MALASSRQEMKKAPGNERCPRGAEDFALVPGAIGRLQAAASLLGCSPVLFNNQDTIDETVASFRANTPHSAVRRDVVPHVPQCRLVCAAV